MIQLDSPVHPEILNDISDIITIIFLNSESNSKNNTLIWEEFENIENVEKLFFCNICQTKCKSGKKLICKHLFCKRCIEKWLIYNSNTCPTCRYNLT